MNQERIDQGPRTKDQGRRTKDQGPRTKDQGRRTKDEGPGTSPKVTKIRDRILAVILLICVIVVGFWEIMGRASFRPFDELALNADDFTEFRPESEQWYYREVPVAVSLIAPAIVAFEMKQKNMRPHSVPYPAPDRRSLGVNGSSISNSGPVLVRLMHGFNIVDCMRIKQYRVELIRDDQEPRTTNQEPRTKNEERTSPSSPKVQIWRLTSPAGKVSLWVTSMLRATDFMETDVDTRDMAFPRVGTPDAPGWNPTGLKWSSFRHPIKNLRQVIRARWNASRCDWMTFLRLKRPAWVSDEVLTLVGEYKGKSVKPANESDVTACVLSAQQLLLHQLQTFRTTMIKPENIQDSP